ncbi:MAG: WYL domain-containing protein [Myxococcaceae bacterium]|jgi:proteasome accessory factor B|nr:WYL domain-containing protein [Myxococcaceae bacterium]
MDRTERLLDLVALLLSEKHPVSWARLRELFKDDYGTGTPEACERKFERDKVELLELGVPLRFEKARGDVEGGYALDKDAYYLPEPGLSPDELAVLYAAGAAALASGAFPGAGDLAHALRKVAFHSERLPALPRVRFQAVGPVDTASLADRLDVLWGAVRARRRVTLEYFSPRSGEVTARAVDPYGLALRRGAWAFAGHCHLRGGVRTFLVHRVRRLEVLNPKAKPPDFEVPADFRLGDVIPRWPWEHRFHAPVDVDVALAPDLEPMAPQLFGVAPVKTSTGASVTVRASDLDALVTTVLSLAPAAKVTGPAEAVARAQALARRVLEAHGGAP